MIEYISLPEERLKLLKRDTKWREQLKNFCNTKVAIQDSLVIEDDDPIIATRVKLVFRAFGRGFDFDSALSLLDEDFNLDIIEIDAYVKTRNRIIDLKARVIGTEGKIKNIIEKKTETKIAVYGKTVGVIGKFDATHRARNVIEMILEGRKFGTVLRFL